MDLEDAATIAGELQAALSNAGAKNSLFPRCDEEQKAMAFPGLEPGTLR